MAEVDPMNPPMKRRRITKPSAGAPVPVYSNKVNMCLQLKPMDSALAEYDTADDVTDDVLWLQSSSQSSVIVIISDSDEDETEETHEKKEEKVTVSCLSPPSLTTSPVRKLSRKTKKKINEVERQLQALTSLLRSSPKSQGRRLRRSRSEPSEEDSREGDVITCGSPVIPPVREIPLKVRCGMEIHKVPVFSSTPLSEVATHLSIKLKTQPSSLLLMKQEVELQTHLSVGELGLSIADIIECVIVAEDEPRSSDNVITIRLQSKNKNSQEFSLHREQPLGSVFNQYLSERPKISKHKVSFQFDGCKVTHNQTPAQLDMEDGDIIEVWN